MVEAYDFNGDVLWAKTVANVAGTIGLSAGPPGIYAGSGGVYVTASDYTGLGLRDSMPLFPSTILTGPFSGSVSLTSQASRAGAGRLGSQVIRQGFTF